MMFLLFGRITTCSALTALDRLEQFGRRRVHRLAAGDDALHAELGEQLGAGRRPSRPRPPRSSPRGSDVGDRRIVRRRGELGLPLGVLLVDLLEQVGDPDAFGRPPTSSATSIAAPMSLVWTWQFQRPSPPTTTIESPIAPHPALKPSDALVGQVEEVHDLVAQLAHVELAVAPRVTVGDGLERCADRAHGPSSGSGTGSGRRRPRAARVEQQQEAGAAGVDHPGLLQHRQHARGCCRAPLAGRRGRRAARSTSEPPASAATLAASAASRHDGEDRALDRLEHRLVGAGGRGLQRLGDLRALRRRPVLERAGEARAGSG